jgi:hypothetical protein
MPMAVTMTEKRRLLARMFTRPVFAAIANTGDWKRALGFLVSHQLLQPGPTRPVSYLFESAWEELRTSYRNEYVYKAELANRLIFGRHSPHTAGLHVELPVGRSIVDIAVFNGTSTAYEIKTEFDSARRLQTQTNDYLKVFDEVFVVAHPSVADAYADVVAPCVGVLALSMSGSLSMVKQSASNRNNVVNSTIFRCLRRAEYLDAVEKTLQRKLDYPNGIIAKKCEDQFCKFDPKDAHRVFVDAMRRRQTAPQIAEFVSRLPHCLRALGYATPLSGRQRTTAVTTLDCKINLAIA